MADVVALKLRVQELAGRTWDLPAIQARYRRLLMEGIAPRPLDPQALLSRSREILDRVQSRAEEYEYLGHN